MPKLILIADDYDDSARMMAELVEFDRPYDTVAAKDGVEALDLARGRRPDAALLDIDMPRIGGMEAARQLRDMFGDERPLLVAMTGRADVADIVASGLFDHVFHKPVELHRLFELLDAA